MTSQNLNSKKEQPVMKEYAKIAVFLTTNALIGIVAVTAIIGFLIGGFYVLDLAVNFFTQITPPSVQIALSVGLLSMVAIIFLAKFGAWVREEVKDIIRTTRLQRKFAK